MLILDTPRYEQLMALFFFDLALQQMRAHICQNLSVLMKHQWQATYSDVSAFLLACEESEDPLRLR
jgi:hypothetical protein